MKKVIYLVAVSCFLLVSAFFAVSVMGSTDTVVPGDLVKTQSSPAVYYISQDGKRYSFINNDAFWCWYSNFSSLKVITEEQMQKFTLGGNVPYYPKKRMVKITTDPKVYALDQCRELHWITSEEVAYEIFGEYWQKYIYDLPDSSFGDYTIGYNIDSADDYVSPSCDDNCSIYRIDDLGLCTVTNPNDLTSIDSDWNQYMNDEYNFSLKIPKEMWHNNGSCAWKSDGDNSYRPLSAMVPVKVFSDEANGAVYISHEYYYELDGRTTEDGGSKFSECRKVDNTLALLREEFDSSHYQRGWKIQAEDINNDGELSQYINENYGTGGCTLGEQTLVGDGLYDVSILGDGLDMQESQCYIGGVEIIRYAPEKNKMAAWGIGQDYRFHKADGADAYDEEMIDSFRFR